MGNSIRVLNVEDNPMDSELLRLTLTKAGYNVKLLRVDTEEAYRNALEEEWDVIISDYNVPGFGGVPALKIKCEKKLKCSFIIISGAVGEESAVEAIKLGADNFVMKDNSERLLASLLMAFKDKEKMRSVEVAQKIRHNIAAVVSHDLKNPLAAIQINLEIIQMALMNLPTSVTQSVATPLARAQKASDRMMNMIRDLLDQARVEQESMQFEFSNQPLKQCLTSIFEEFDTICSKRGIQFLTEVEIENFSRVQLRADSERLHQALGNILGNAVKYTPSGGRITLRLKASGENLFIEIEDTGEGMDQKSVRHIFEPFWQETAGSHQGLGIGLFITKTILDAHGASLNVQSAKGVGTTFTIEIPNCLSLITEEAFEVSDLKSESARGISPLPIRSLGAEIFLIEDDEDLREVLVEVLESKGMSVRSFHSGIEALRVSQNLSQAQIPKVFITDQNLDNISGTELIAELKSISKSWSEVKFILMTADKLVLNKLPVSVDAAFSKPLKLEILLGRLEELLSQKKSHNNHIPSSYM